MGKADTIAFDKTRILTCGALTVSDILPWDTSLDENELLSLAASAEAKSEHPLARAILYSAKSHNIPIMESSSFTMIAGKGIFATVGHRRLLCGSESLLGEHHILLSRLIQSDLHRLRAQGKACVIIAENQTCIGMLVSDTLRPEAKQMAHVCIT